PSWFGNLDRAIAELRSLPWPWVDRPTVERVLRVGRRRAQQILQPCVRVQIGSSGLADREELIAHLQGLAAGEAGYYEQKLRELDRSRASQLLVEAPTEVVNRQLGNLPEGIVLAPGSITVHFTTPVEALEKLLSVAMAAGNDLAAFERMVSQPE